MNNHVSRWYPPIEGELKINVDASFYMDSSSCIVGMVLRDHNGSFVAGKNLSFVNPTTAFEAEAVGVREALSWIKEQHLHTCKIKLESDSLVVVQSINNGITNLLEVGEVLEQCKNLCNELSATSIHFVRNQANRVAHEIARIPCLVNCQNVFTSLPTYEEGIVLSESSF